MKLQIIAILTVVISISVIIAVFGSYFLSQHQTPFEYSSKAYAEKIRQEKPPDIAPSKTLPKPEEKIIEYKKPVAVQEEKIQYRRKTEEVKKAGEVGYTKPAYEMPVKKVMPEEANESRYEGPPSEKMAIPLPIFEYKTVTDSGPVREESAAAPAPVELPEFKEEISPEGPKAPPDKESQPLPPFTPVTSKTGPVPVDENR